MCAGLCFFFTRLFNTSVHVCRWSSKDPTTKCNGCLGCRQRARLSLVWRHVQFDVESGVRSSQQYVHQTVRLGRACGRGALKDEQLAVQINAVRLCVQLVARLDLWWHVSWSLSQDVRQHVQLLTLHCAFPFSITGFVPRLLATHCTGRSPAR